MASNYPAALDSLSNPDGGDALSTGHAAQHGNVNDAVEAIEGELGTDPAGASATVKARFEAIEADSWVTSARIADGTVTGTDIASGTVTSANLVDGTIVNADVSGTAAIDKTKISGTAVTAADTGTVTSTMILDGTIVNADINAAAAIDKTKISGTAVTTADSGSVTSGMILDGTIVNGDVNASAAIAATKISGTAVTQADSGTVTSTMIANGTITGTDIASGTVTSTNILDGTIVNADVATGAAIDVSKLTGVVTSAGVGNLLTAAQATGSEAPTNGANTNCALSIDTSQYYQGTDSLLLTSAASGIMASKYFTVAIPTAGTYTVFCRVRTDQTVMGLTMSATGTGITSDALKVAANSTGWTDYVSTFTATAATTLNLSVATTGLYGHPTGAGQKLWIDTLGVWSGAGGLWRTPGVVIPNLGTYTDESVGRRIFTWDTVNSRWQMTYGDTGLRDMYAAYTLSNSWVVLNSGGAYLRRVGQYVECTLHLNGASASADLVGSGLIPAGFRPSKAQYVASPLGTSGGAIRLTEISAGGTFTIYSRTTGVQYNQFNWTTNEAWPTSLPGVAVGTIPQ